MSIDFESALNLEHDEADVATFLADHGGTIERDDRIGQGQGDAAVYWATIRPRAKPNDIYIARIEWFAYPYESPSLKFASTVRGSLTDPHAWPIVTGYRPTSLDICRPMCREGFSLHPEWRQGSTAWPTTGNPFLWVVETLQFQLDHEYQGRYR